MANLLESLAGGLRSAAGVLNPRVQEQTFAADERTRGRAEQLALEERRMQMQMQQQLMMQQQQHAFQQSTPQAQMQMEALKNEKSFREAAAQAQGDPEKLATAAMQYGKPEIAMNLYKAQEDRVARLEMAKEQNAAKSAQFDKLMEDKNLSREQQAALARQSDETKRQGQMIQVQIAQMGDSTKRMLAAMKQGSGGGDDAPVAVVVDGKPVYVSRRDALGKSPASSASGKLSASLPQAKLRTETMVQNMDRLETAMKDLHDDPGLPNITGTVAGRTPNITNRATGAQAKLESIKSQVFQSALQSMREASKTGGAVGNVSDREGDKLENTLAGLSQAQGTPDFKKALNKAMQQLRLSKTLIRNAFDEQYGDVVGTSPKASSVLKFDAQGNPIP